MEGQEGDKTGKEMSVRGGMEGNGMRDRQRVKSKEGVSGMREKGEGVVGMGEKGESESE